MDMVAIFRGLVGVGFLIALNYLFSSNRRLIDWRLVGAGLLMQLVFAIGILKVPFLASIFESISSFFVVVLNFTKQGSNFLFGNLLNIESQGFIFAFQVLPTIIFFSALTSLLFYLGIIQKVVYFLSVIMAKFMKISGAENLSAAANIFLGQTEAPLMIKPYLSSMNRSELLCVMVGGMATVAGGVLAAYVGFLGGDDPVQQLFYAKHLLAASVMSAPATVLTAKMLIPQDQEVNRNIEIPREKMGANFIEAISIGTTEGLGLAFNVGAMLIVFIAMIAMVNYVLGDMIGAYTGLNALIASATDNLYTSLSLQFLLGYICAPVVWLLGVAADDMVYVGQLLGEKTILNEFVAFTTLGKMKTEQLFKEPRSLIFATYILTGFANFASIGIQVGGIGALAPNKRSELSLLGLRALYGGTIASLLTASIVGMLI